MRTFAGPPEQQLGRDVLADWEGSQSWRGDALHHEVNR
jgi:hypothetical protein